MAEIYQLPENGSGNKHKSLRSVSFPDGIEFTADNMTHFTIQRPIPVQKMPGTLH